MAITVVGTPTTSGDAGGGAVTSISVTVPAGAVSGHIAVIFLGQWKGDGTGGAPTVTPPSGFTQKGANWSSGDGLAKNSIWWKRLTGADTGSYSFSSFGGSTFYTTCQCILFSGGATSGDPWDAVATPLTGTWGSYSSISVTMTDAGGALVHAVYNDTAGTHTPPTSFTEAADNDSGALNYWIPGSSGSKTASGGSVSSSSAAGEWLGALLSSASSSGETVRPVLFAPSLWAPGGMLLPPPQGANTAVPNSVPSAGNAVGTGQAFDAAINVGPVAGNAAGTGTAGAASVVAASMDPNQALPQSGPIWFGPHWWTAASVQLLGNTAVPAAGSVSAGVASGTGTAYDATITVAPTAGAGAGTGSAGAPTANVGPAAGNAAGTGAANTATDSIAVNAENAAGTGTAYQPAVTVPGAPTDANQALPQSAPMFFSPQWASGQLAGDTTVAAAGSTSASAGVATGTGTAFGPTVTVAPVAGAAAGTGTAGTSVITSAPNAGNAAGTGSAGAATDNIAVTAGNAAGTGTAYQPTVSTTGNQNAQAGNAAGTGAANQPTVTVSPAAGNAAGTGTANNARPNIGTGTGIATATGAALQPSIVAPNATAGNATGTGTAYQPLIVISMAAGQGTGTGAAANAAPTRAISVAAGLASGTGQAFNTTNGVPVVLYPIHAGTITDVTGRDRAGTPTDTATRYRAGAPT